MRSRRYQSCQQSSFLSYTLRRHWRYVFGHILRLLFEAPECYQVTNHFVTLYRRIYYVWLISSSSISCRCTLVQYQRETSELPTIFKCWILRWIAKKKQRWRLIEFSSSIFVHRAIFYRLVFPIFQGTNCPCVLFCSFSLFLFLLFFRSTVKRVECICVSSILDGKENTRLKKAHVERSKAAVDLYNWKKRWEWYLSTTRHGASPSLSRVILQR